MNDENAGKAVLGSRNSNDDILALSRVLFRDDGYDGLKWQMTLAERCALVQVLRMVRPRISVEVGTAFGGALSVISSYTSGRVYSVDMDPSCKVRLAARFPDCEFISGDSRSQLPELLRHLEAQNTLPDFILLDGEHTCDALTSDIRAVVDRSITKPMYLLIHDSYNPECRKAIIDAGWLRNPAFRYLEVDFVPGILHERADVFNQLWGGLALAVFAEEKLGDVVMNAGYAYQQELAKKRSEGLL